jgi:hypothetical protein
LYEASVNDAKLAARHAATTGGRIYLVQPTEPIPEEAKIEANPTL